MDQQRWKWTAFLAIACLAVSARPTFGDEVAESFMQALESGDFGSAHAMLDEQVTDQLTEPLLIQTWEALPAQFGEYRDRGAEFPVDVAGDLPGLLTLPHGDGPFAAAVLVHGSGPNDRDETIGPNKPFRDLAEFIHARPSGQP